MYSYMRASARACRVHSTRLPHIIPVDVYTGARTYDDDWSPLRVILQPPITYLGFFFSLALCPHNVNKFVLIASCLHVCGYTVVLSQQAPK